MNYQLQSLFGREENKTVTHVYLIFRYSQHKIPRRFLWCVCGSKEQLKADLKSTRAKTEIESWRIR